MAFGAMETRTCDDLTVQESNSKWKEMASKLEAFDYLKLLYPHDRDDHCVMEEVQHKYYVHNLPYSYSVSSVWKVFFPEFNVTMTVQTCLEKSQSMGLTNLESSAYNLYLFLIYFKRLSPGDDCFWNAVNAACVSANAHPSARCCWVSKN